MNKNTVSINPIQIESKDINDKIQVYNFFNVVNGIELSNFNLIRFIVSPNSLSDLDQHKVKEYWYFAKGNGLLYIDGEEVEANEGEVYFFDSRVTHQVKNLSDSSDLEILSIWW